MVKWITKGVIISVLILLALGSTSLSADNAPLKLNLEQALGIAFEQSLAVDESRVQRAKGVESLVEGVAGFLPRLSASSTTAANSVDSLGQGIWVSQFTLSQPVVDASVILGLANGIYGQGLARAQSRQTTAKLILDVENAYYDLAKAQALLASAEGQYNRALENQRIADRQYRLGGVNKSDKLRAEASLLAAESDLISARTNLAQSERVMADRIGLDAWRPIEVEDLPAAQEPDSSISYVISPAMLEHNPDYDVLRRQVQTSDLTVLAAWASILPSLSLSAQKSLSQDGVIPAFSNWDSTPTSYGVTVSFPLADIKGRVLGISKAHLDRKEARINLAQQDLAFRERLAALLSAQETAYRGYEVAYKNVDLSNEVYRLTARSYELGASSLADLLQVEADLVQAERTLVVAKASYWSSRAELNYFLGIDVFQEFSQEE